MNLKTINLLLFSILCVFNSESIIAQNKTSMEVVSIFPDAALTRMIQEAVHPINNKTKSCLKQIYL